MSTSRETLRIEEAYFKSTDGGWLFETPNPWILAPGRRYLVTEVQRSALLDILRWRRPNLIVAAIVAFAMGVSGVWLSGHDNPTGLDLVGMAVTILVPLYVAVVVMTRRQVRRIAPIIAAAVPTQAKSSIRERYQAVGTAIPARRLKWAVVLFALLAVWHATSFAVSGKAPAFGFASGSILNVVALLGCALFMLYLLRVRRRQNGA